MPTSTYDLIESKSLSSNTTTVTFSSIPATYTHLLLKLSTRDGSYSSLNASMYMRFNGDTTANYVDCYAYGAQTSGGGTVSGAKGASSSMFFGQMPGPSYATTMWSNSYSIILNYTSSLAKRVNHLSCNMTQNENGPWQTFASTRWGGTATINAINLTSDGNYLSGSFIQLYGISN